MNRFKNQLITAGVLSVLGIISTVMNSHQAAAQGPPDGLAVRTGNSVPVPVSGTVNVGNLGATTLPVAVTNFPAVQPVTVTNFPATITVANAQGSLPFVASLTSSSPTLAIPPVVNRQTVISVAITEVGGFCTGIGNFPLALQDINGNPVASFYFTVENVFSDGIYPVSAQETGIYVAAGHSVGITDNIPPHGCRMDLSGFYVTQ